MDTRNRLEEQEALDGEGGAALLYRGLRRRRLDKLLVAAGLASALVDDACDLAVTRRTECDPLQRSADYARS